MTGRDVSEMGDHALSEELYEQLERSADRTLATEVRRVAKLRYRELAHEAADRAFIRKDRADQKRLREIGFGW